MMTTSDNHNQAFGRLLRFWRDAHSLSQQQLADLLDSSTRHINRLENSHVRPSKSMVLQIVEALGLKDRDSNNILLAAGYKSRPSAEDLYSDQMKWLRSAMSQTLRALEPYPSLLTDRCGNILMVNRAWLGLLYQRLPIEERDSVNNYLDFLFYYADPQGETEIGKNVRALLMMWLQQEVALHNAAENRQRLTEFRKSPLAPEDWKQRAAGLDPITSYRVPLTVNGETMVFRNVSLITSPVGTISYVAEPRLAINTFYPEDDEENLQRFMSHEYTHPLLAS